MSRDGWQYQGRQYHQWFGHGTKPKFDAKLTVGRAAYDVAAIDFVPREVPLSPDAMAVGQRIFAVAKEIEASMQGFFDSKTVSSASSTLHALFAKNIREMNIPGVRVEASFNPRGDDAEYGELGSSRVDVIYTNPRTNRIEGIWDWKVGGAMLTARRARLLSERLSGVAGSANLPRYRIPVIEFHVDLVPDR